MADHSPPDRGHEEPEVVDSGEEHNGGRESYDPHQKSRVRGTAHQVSRPPSSHITRVEEEPSADGRPPSSGRRSVETVDRGVGPTPLPQPPPPAGSGASSEPRVPPYLSFHPFPDPRNGLLEAAYAGLQYGYPHYPYPINSPLPLNPSTLEGRYHWPPPASPFHQSLHGLSSSPAQSDVSLLSMRSPMIPGEPVTHLASRIHWEQLQRNYYSPFASRRLSPASLAGLPLGGASPLVGEYPPPPSLSGRSFFTDVPPTPGSGSITLPGSLESSRLNSPRPSIVGNKSRKRALSHSPISDYLDIQSLTRSSEGSLQLAPFLQHSSRSSSAASGSYGHLSAASVGTVSPAMIPTGPYLRPGSMAPSSFFYPPAMHPLLARQAHMGQMLPPSSQLAHTVHKHEPQPQISTTTKEPGSSSIVSSTMDSLGEARKAKVKKETENIHIASMEPEDDDDQYGERGSHIPQEGEPDFIETNCHWADCKREFETQDELVKHISQDHIQSNKKAFVCRWTDCNREEKPFKAQYMLVVHMRRHTGEKPHRCSFEGCTKAYSRLENLKTHLRSHTGEKPYMCEFPGCTKAFSNASDRAKHQNRTHSNAKPYVCKAIGCTKRYTDPSSLRKHVKTVHGADFYHNKKHKGDETCYVKKEDPDRDPDSCEMARQGEESLSLPGHSGPASTDNRHAQDSYNSAPSSHSQPSPESSPDVNVISEPGLSMDVQENNNNNINNINNNINNIINNPINIMEHGVVLEEDEEEEDVIIPESNEAEIPGSSALLTRRNQVHAGHVLQKRMKGRIGSKPGSLSPLPQLPSIHNQGGRPPPGGTTQVSITELPQKVSQLKGSPQHKRIGDIMGEAGSWRDTSTLLPSSRRESNTSNTSTLSSYMSSMRSAGSTFSSRRSSGASQFSSRRSSGASARLSIANSPYEYDITGNLPNSVSRRSSGESSTNIGSVSALMQKANLGGHSNLVVVHPPPNGSAAGPGGNHSTTTAGAADGSGSGVSANCGGDAAGTVGFGCSLGQKYYNERLARYFSARRELDGIRTSTPCRTPQPHEVPKNEVRRASDPVRTKDPDFMSLKRYHSLNMVPPLPTPASMKRLQKKTSSNNTFQSSRSSIATENGLPEDNRGVKDIIKEAELEEKMLEDSEDMIIPDDMKRFLNECCHDNSDNQQQQQPVPAGTGAEPIAGDTSPAPDFPPSDLSFEPCDLQGDDAIFLSPATPQSFPDLLAGNLQVQTGFADLQQAVTSGGGPPGSMMDQFQASPAQRANFGPNVPNGWSPMQQSPGAMDPRMPQVKMNLHSPPMGPENYPCAVEQQQASMNTSPAFSPGNMADGGRVTCNMGAIHHQQQQQMQANLASSRPAAGQGHPESDGHSNMGDPNYSMGQWGVGSGGGAYLSQHNLMQHQLQHQLQHQQLQRQQKQQQQQHPCAGFEQPPSSPFMPQPPPPTHFHHHHNNENMMLPPLGGFSPMPPPGDKPVHHRPKRASPQVQVPHISQSQIPANAKAASRNQAMIKQQQLQQQQQMVPGRNPALNPYQHPSLPQNENFPARMYQNHVPHPPNNSYPQHSPYPPSNYPAHPVPNPVMHPHPPNQMLSNTQQFPLSPNQMPCSNQHLMPMANGPLPRSTNHAPVPPCHSGHNPAPLHPSQLQNMPPMMQQHAHCPNQPMPQHLSPYHGRGDNPMEMSPGCNQVTSSTDCKDSQTAPPIEDFMDNLTSISTENLMDNINSISQENIAYSPTPMSLRTASQNSGRYNSLMNTSNMVVNDMSSVLTQLAEENKFLNMRP